MSVTDSNDSKPQVTFKKKGFQVFTAAFSSVWLQMTTNWTPLLFSDPYKLVLDPRTEVIWMTDNFLFYVYNSSPTKLVCSEFRGSLSRWLPRCIVLFSELRLLYLPLLSSRQRCYINVSTTSQLFLQAGSALWFKQCVSVNTLCKQLCHRHLSALLRYALLALRSHSGLDAAWNGFQTHFVFSKEDKLPVWAHLMSPMYAPSVWINTKTRLYADNQWD